MISLAALSFASAAEKTYRYYRFDPVKIFNNGGNMQLAEFTFSLGGNILNTNNRNGSGTGVVSVAITSGGQNPNDGEGPAKVGDGTLGTKWFKGNPFDAGEELTFDFGSPVTIDSYNWASANDSVDWSRSPISWTFQGSNDGTTWDVIDVRNDFPIINEDNTYQVGFTLPAVISPLISSFTVPSGNAGGTAAIVLNGGQVGLAWETASADSVTISPAPGSVPLDGSTTVTPPASATTTYTLTAAQSGIATPATATVTVRAVAGGEASYQYIRFKATKLRTGEDTGLIQLREFSFFNNGTPVEVVGVENPGGASYPEENVGNLIDGSANDNKWLDFNNAPVIFDLGEVKTIDGYSFFTANDADDRDPIQWILQGSNDQETWTVIESVNFDYPTPTARNVNGREIPLPGSSIQPGIFSFTSSARNIVVGEPFTLSWQTGAATTVSIDQGVGTVAASGSISLSPPVGTTTYTITATSANGTTTDTVTVNAIQVPAITTISYADFSSSASELSLRGTAQIEDNRLRLTEDIGGQQAEAWFRLKQPVAGGFEANFKISMSIEPTTITPPADGIAFVIQNSPDGVDSGSYGEDGLPGNAVNVSFKTFGADSTRIQVRQGDLVVGSVQAYEKAGVVLKGIPDNPATAGNEFLPNTLATLVGEDPYQVRIVYVPGSPGHIDVYWDGVAVLQNVEVDLEEAGAVDSSGKAFVGFSARTGGYSQNNDIVDWQMNYGDFSAIPPFGLVKSVIHPVRNGTVTNTVIDLVWNAGSGQIYNVTRDADLLGPWEFVSEHLGEDGQLGARVVIDPATVAREFFRVEEAP
jgi:hypothetical protein